MSSYPSGENLSPTGLEAALIFALVAERLSRHYENDHWQSDGSMRLIARDWLARSKVSMNRGRLSELISGSNDLARQIAASLSREAGLRTTHEMLESLDSRHHSALGQAMMDQCVAWTAETANPTQDASKAET
jgi:hypothetical protein